VWVFKVRQVQIVMPLTALVARSVVLIINTMIAHRTIVAGQLPTRIINFLNVFVFNLVIAMTALNCVLRGVRHLARVLE